MKILVVDDHPLIREGVVRLMQAIAPSAAVVQAARLADALSVTALEAFDLILLDLQLGELSGLDALRHLRRRLPSTPVAILSARDDADTVMQALEMGACAFVAKSSDPDRIREAFTHLLAGSVVLPPSLPHSLTPSDRAPLPGPAGTRPPRDDVATVDGLTDRQFEVLALLVRGLSNKLIARRLDIAESTVKLHVTSILRTLGVGSRAQAIVEVARRGITLPPPG